MRSIKITNPELTEAAAESLHQSLDMYLTSAIPESIAGFMITIPTRRLLRSIYGSDLRAALALLWVALGEIVWVARKKTADFWRYKVMGRSIDKEIEELLLAVEKE